MKNRFSIFQLLRTPLIGETPFAMTSFLTNGRLHPNNGCHGDCLVAHPGSAAGFRAPCYQYVVQFGKGRLYLLQIEPRNLLNKETGTFH